MREIKILKQLRNKNIVPLVDIAVDRGMKRYLHIHIFSSDA